MQCYKCYHLLSPTSMKNVLRLPLAQSLSCIKYSPAGPIVPSVIVLNSRSYIYEPDKKGKGYPYQKDVWPEFFKLENYRGIWPFFVKESKNAWEEFKDHWRNDPIMDYRHNEVDIWWRFRTEKDLEKWVVTTDSDLAVGRSEASLTISPQGYALFSGKISTDFPQDGIIKRSGFANFGSLPAMKSFGRETAYDWTLYTHLVMRVRGDGRSYMINMHLKNTADAWWFDIYHFILFTRGGPYWQTAKIPLSKFFLGSKGRIQDSQFPPPLERIMKLSFTIGEGTQSGPFSLEIQYIGLTHDDTHREETAYEMYQVPVFLVAH